MSIATIRLTLAYPDRRAPSPEERAARRAELAEEARAQRHPIGWYLDRLRAEGLALRIYLGPDRAWIAEGEEGAERFYVFPAERGGWARRRPWAGEVPAAPSLPAVVATGTGWPGAYGESPARGAGAPSQGSRGAPAPCPPGDLAGPSGAGA